MARSDTSHLRALGAGPLEPTRALERIVLDTSRPVRVTFRTAELLARCPVTSQRDLYEATIEIEASATLESKSLKLYLASWDREEILAEDLANSLADDIAAALGDHLTGLTVTLRQNVRGGVEITVETSR